MQHMVLMSGTFAVTILEKMKFLSGCANKKGWVHHSNMVEWKNAYDSLQSGKCYLIKKCSDFSPFQPFSAIFWEEKEKYLDFLVKI